MAKVKHLSFPRMELSAISARRSGGATDFDAEENSYNRIGYGEKYP
jgi:hypothetical protein